jgi:hypothetical protein
MTTDIKDDQGEDQVEVELEEGEQEVEKVQSEPEYTAEETIALARGWKPKEEWDGDEGDWKPAKAFNEVGDLKEKLAEREKDNKKLNKVVTLMKEHHLNVRQSAYEEALKTLKAERVEALKNENFAKAEEIRDQIDEMRDDFKKEDILPKEIEKEVQQQLKEPDPEFFAFMDRNPWYKPGGKDEISKRADALGYAYYQEDPKQDFKTIITKVEKDIRKLFPEKFDTPKGGPNDAGNRQGGGSKEKVSLSREQLEVAKTFGMTPEEYAKELKSYKGR